MPLTGGFESDFGFEPTTSDYERLVNPIAIRS